MQGRGREQPASKPSSVAPGQVRLRLLPPTDTRLNPQFSGIPDLLLQTRATSLVSLRLLGLGTAQLVDFLAQRYADGN